LLDKGNKSKAVILIPLTIYHKYDEFTISLNKFIAFINKFVT